MTPEQYAETLLLDVQGLDDNQPQTRKTPTMRNFDAQSPDDEQFGADDPVKQAGLSTLALQLSIANGAALNVNLFTITDLAAAALPTGLISPTIANYRDAIAYFHANPARTASMLFASNESASAGAPVLASIQVAPTRKTPFGLQTSNSTRIQSYQTTQDFQANRVTLPLAIPLDTFTSLSVTSDTNNSGAAVIINLTIMFGKRIDQRRGLGAGGQQVAMRPNGRGVVQVG